MAAEVIEKTEFSPNKEQMRCIMADGGKHLVLAGPGTGKTFTVAMSIKQLINDKKAKPENILCLTYTEAGVGEMIKKLKEHIGNAAFDVNVYTYHGFCNEILQNCPGEFKLNDNVRPITNAAQKELLKECVDEMKLNLSEYIDESKSFYSCIKELSNQITAIKQNRILTKADFDRNIEKTIDKRIKHLEAAIEQKKEYAATKDKNLKPKSGTDANKTEDALQNLIDEEENNKLKLEQLWKFYSHYRDKLKDSSYIDFNDMINFVLEKFEKAPSFLDEIRGKYTHIFVDEYQDTNPQQNEIVFKLTGEPDSDDNKNIIVVGDDDQIIFSFQGARLDTVHRFLGRYDEIKKNDNIICLKENHRSTQNILDCAKMVINRDSMRLANNPQYKEIVDKNLKSMNATDSDEKVKFTTYATVEQEYDAILKELKEVKNKLDNGEKVDYIEKFSDIAIIMTSNSQLKNMAELLEVKNIPFELKNGKDLFEIKAPQVLYYYASALSDITTYSDRLLKIMLMDCFEIECEDYALIAKDASKARVNVIKHIENLLEKEKEQKERKAKGEKIERDEEVKIKNRAKLEKFVSDFYSLKEYSQKESIKDTILEIGRVTGFFTFYLPKKLEDEINATENILGIKKFVEEASDFSSIKGKKASQLLDFVQYLDMVTNDPELAITIDKPEASLNAVQLTTYHSSKGREFKVVYMPSLGSKKWESDSKSSFEPKIPLDPDKHNLPDYEKLNTKEIEEFFKVLKISDKTKLMYVGMTRAKKLLKLSCFATQKRSELLDGLFDETGKSFNPDIFEVNDLSEEGAGVSIHLRDEAKSYTEQFNTLCDIKFSAIKRFSASSLNSYLECPRKYFYNNVLCIDGDSGSTEYSSYGLAIHSAFETAINSMLNEKKMLSKEEILKIATDKLDIYPFPSENERDNYKSKAKAAIDNVYLKFELNKDKFVHAEFSFGSDKSSQEFQTVELKGEINGKEVSYPFTGSIDRVDKEEDGTYTIYDYKTGRYYSDIKIGGNHEGYYNQIAIYRYFFEKLTGNKVGKTIFIFTNDEVKKATPYAFELNLTDEEVQDVAKKYLQAIEDIKAHKFEAIENKSEHGACGHCSHRAFCGLQRRNKDK